MFKKFTNSLKDKEKDEIQGILISSVILIVLFLLVIGIVLYGIGIIKHTITVVEIYEVEVKTSRKHSSSYDFNILNPNEYIHMEVPELLTESMSTFKIEDYTRITDIKWCIITETRKSFFGFIYENSNYDIEYCSESKILAESYKEDYLSYESNVYNAKIKLEY